MPWAMVISAGIGLLGANSAQRSADRQAREQAALQRETLGLQREQFAFGKDQYNQWANRFYPQWDRLIDESQKEIMPDYGMIAGDVANTFQGQRGAMLRQASRMGVNPADGAYAGAMSDLGGEEAKTHILARQAGRRGAEADRWSRMTGVIGVGGGIPGGASGMMSGALAGMQGGVNAMGQQAQYAQNNAAQAWQGAGYGASQVDWGGIWNSVRGSSPALQLNTRPQSAMPAVSNIPQTINFNRPGG